MSVNPYASPAAEPASRPATSGSSSLKEIAISQKLVLYVVLLNIACLVPVYFWGGYEAMRIARSLLWLLFIPIQIYCFIRLGTALKMSTTWIVLSCIGLCIPCVSMVVLLTLINKATRQLQRAGVKVGLMGAKLRSIP